MQRDTWLQLIRHDMCHTTYNMGRLALQMPRCSESSCFGLTSAGPCRPTQSIGCMAAFKFVAHRGTRCGQTSGHAQADLGKGRSPA